ncbi:iron permease [Geomonas limicola]|uniref:Iron permease n=1 Tax=Geomonas limicola TaxID=2740186 RepID=A0A6V8NA04_9BACT|nr:FTR1 family protein [Geomonas limicola]GFO69435.1 iron permease [Geomonas limicola]
MKKVASIAVLVTLFAAVLIGWSGSDARAAGAKKGNGTALIEETGSYLNQSLALYKKGDLPGAKAKAQAAYFEVYENLEGLIRVNVSARKNIELEEDFVAIRKMIVAKVSADQLEKSIGAFMVKLRAVGPELESGIELVGEPCGAKSAEDATKKAGPTGGEKAAHIEPVWRQAVDAIEANLAKARETQKKGDGKGAGDQVIQAQFDDYKNSLLSTAVRRYVSPERDFEHNAAFSQIAKLMRAAATPAEVETGCAALVRALNEELPTLGPIDGAVAKGDAGKPATASGPEKDWNKVSGDLVAEVQRAIELYGKGDATQAVAAVQDAYFDIFESTGMESKIGARDANLKAGIEAHFSQLVGQLKAKAPAEALQGTLENMKADLEKATKLLGKGGDSPRALFIYSLMIIVREGFEAILVITAIIAYLVKSGNREKLKVIYNAVSCALVLSVITAVLVKWVFKTSAASQEATEGATMLLASLVLFSVSYWIVSKAEAQKWSSYLKEKVGSALSSNSLKGLWFAAFLAVYREGAETVLFYQALGADAAGTGLGAIAGGFVAGCALLFVIYLVMRHGAIRLPIRPFFLATGGLLYYLSFVFAGKGVMELVEGKLFVPSAVPWMPTLPALGIYPYLQTLLPQAALLLAALAALILMGKKRPQQAGA